MVFAESVTEEISVNTRLLSKTSLEETDYDAFGVATKGYQRAETRRRTERKVKKPGEEEKVIGSTETEIQEVKSSWRSSRLKVDSITGNSSAPADDGSNATSSSYLNLKYDGSGKLASAEGGSSATSYKPEEGEVTNSHTTTTSTTKNAYRIEDGQALVKEAKTEGETYKKTTDKAGNVIDEGKIEKFANTTTNTLAAKGGDWVIMNSKNVSDSYGVKKDGTPDGTPSHIEKGTTFNRDANGNLLPNDPITVTMSGTRVLKNGEDGRVTQKLAKEDFEATNKFDPQMGHYINHEKAVWREVVN